jgi:hypothetical protein
MERETSNALLSILLFRRPKLQAFHQGRWVKDFARTVL